MVVTSFVEWEGSTPSAGQIKNCKINEKRFNVHNA